ncbi:MAG: nuclear transport factor 2 family protein [Actinobacteria bacterium]|nr:MAG: nuclear transport factor 2 family protein [Actinomycetota bacterium]
MSENLELVRSIYACWERGDFSSIEWAHPDVELVAIGGPDPGSTIGREAVRHAWRDFLGAWQDYRVAGGEYRELERGQILVLNVLGGRGKGSGLEVERTDTRGANLFELRDGKVKRLVLYWDRERAFADLGLEE